MLRFRSLRLANPIVASELLPCPGARALLECAGFEHKDSSDGNTYGASAASLFASCFLSFVLCSFQIPKFEAFGVFTTLRSQTERCGIVLKYCTLGDPGYLILPLESDLAAVQAARSRLKLEAQRRVR